MQKDKTLPEIEEKRRSKEPKGCIWEESQLETEPAIQTLETGFMEVFGQIQCRDLEMTKHCVSNNHLIPAESTASNKKSRSIRVICPHNRSRSALLRTEKGPKEVKTM